MPPAMPSGNGQEPRMLLRCAVCRWYAKAIPPVAFPLAVHHAEVSGHAITYRGKVQDLSKFMHQPVETDQQREQRLRSERIRRRLTDFYAKELG